MCRKLLSWTMHNSPTLQQLGFMLIRIAMGSILLIFGYNKLMAGTEYLTQTGSAISYFGITHGYLLWGYAAALTEFCGGIAYILGLCTRIASLPLMFHFIVAMRFHMQHNDPFTIWAFPALFLCLVVSFFIAGSGRYALDSLLHSHSHDE
jgi:putative oxidoreductase